MNIHLTAPTCYVCGGDRLKKSRIGANPGQDRAGDAAHWLVWYQCAGCGEYVGVHPVTGDVMIRAAYDGRARVLQTVADVAAKMRG
jgi:hypothetical protein